MRVRPREGRERKMTADFKVHRYAATGDTGLFPVTDAARDYIRQVRDMFGPDALCGMSLFVETSRGVERLSETINELRAHGYTVAGR